jgi:hypothetical protein
MVSLVRQPVAQASVVDKISSAAIDAFLEIPTKVDGRQGRFQAFEISVTTEKPLPVAPLPAGAQHNLPGVSPQAITPPATDPNLRGAWVPPDFTGAIPPFKLSADEFSTTSCSSTTYFISAAAPFAEESLPSAELPPAVVDAVFGELSSALTDNPVSTPRLDIAAATLLAIVIGRALWPARVPKAGERESGYLQGEVC